MLCTLAVILITNATYTHIPQPLPLSTITSYIVTTTITTTPLVLDYFYYYYIVATAVTTNIGMCQSHLFYLELNTVTGVHYFSGIYHKIASFSLYNLWQYFSQRASAVHKKFEFYFSFKFLPPIALKLLKKKYFCSFLIQLARSTDPSQNISSKQNKNLPLKNTPIIQSNNMKNKRFA